MAPEKPVDTAAPTVARRDLISKKEDVQIDALR